MRDMTPEEAERLLTEWVTVNRDRDNRVQAAIEAGVSKYRVNRITGIGRSTIDRILAAPAPPGPTMCKQEHLMITDTSQGSCAMAQTPWSRGGGSGI